MPVFIDPRTGERFDSVPDEDAERARSEFGLVPEAEYELEQSHGGNDVRAFATGAAAGAFDAAVAPVKLVTTGAGALAEALGADGIASEVQAFNHQISGRQFLENLNAVAGELAGQGNAEAVARAYSEEARKDAEANPWASTSGYLGGQVLGGLGVAGASKALGKAAASAAASSTLGRVAAAGVEGAAEGAALSAGQASEDAWIRDERLTSEQLLGAVGWGTLLGGGLGVGLGAGAAGARSVASSARGASDVVNERVRKMFAPKMGDSATVADVSSRALGVDVSKAEGSKIKDAFEWFRDKVERAQSVATGADLDTIQSYGALRRDAKALSGRQLYANRGEILETGKREFNQALADLNDAADPVINEYRYAGLKREHVAQHIKPEAAAEQLAEARTRADALERMLVPIRRPGTGKAAREVASEAIDREAYVQTFEQNVRDQIDDELDDEIRDALESLGDDAVEGSRKWQRVEQDILRERVARQGPAVTPADPLEGSLRAEVGSAGVLDDVSRYIGRHVDALRKTTDPVEAFMLLDESKRALQKYANTIGLSAEALVSRNPERARAARTLSDYLERFQEPVRKSLENESVWGRAGANQRAINETFSRYIQSDRIFQQRFMRIESRGYRGQGVVRRPREDAIGGFLNKIGLAESAPTEQHLRAHLRATTDFLEAIDSSLDIGSKRDLVAKARATHERLTAVMDELTETAAVANKIDALLEADAGGEGKALVGALLGGPLGAVAGAAFDVAGHPGRMLRQVAAVERIAKRFEGRVDEAIEGLFRRIDAPANDVAAAPVVTAAGEISGNAAVTPAAGAVRGRIDAPSRVRPAAVAGAAAVPATLALFMGGETDKQAAFRTRAREIASATADMGERVRETVDRDMSDLAADFPRLAGGLADGMSRAALFLEGKLPASYRAAAPGAIGRSTRPVADHDLAKFARYWSAVHDPVSVIADMGLGMVTAEQVEALKVVYPQVFARVSEKLLERAADHDAAGRSIPHQTRAAIGRVLGVEVEPAFARSVLATLEQARAERDQAPPPASSVPDLASSVGPESVQIANRAAGL